MAIRIFTEEYDSIRITLKSETFSSDTHDSLLIGRLKSALAEDGPDKKHGTALDDLRKRCERGLFERIFGSATDKESAGILDMAGPSANLGKKAAALKFLRHFYLMKKFGGHSLWVLALPDAYRKWPSEQIGLMTSKDSIEAQIARLDERFTPQRRNDLLNSSQTAAAWANKVQGMCSKTSGLGARRVDRLVRRWFGDEDSTDEDIRKMRHTLRDGFKKIASAALSGKMVFTDNPVDRGTADENVFAYVWYDRLNVVYIEGQFFRPGLFGGPKHWALIVVHELSHSQCGTKDIDGHYDFNGIKPKRGSFPSSQAITNADSWAWFAADCNYALTEKNRADALK